MVIITCDNSIQNAIICEESNAAIDVISNVYIMQSSVKSLMLLLMLSAMYTECDHL